MAEQFALTFPQLVALKHLSKAGPMTMSDLTDRMDVTRGAMTGLIDRLEEAKLVMRRHSETDRRVIFLDLTPHGQHVLAQTAESWHQETQRWLMKLDDAERNQVSQALGRLLEVGLQAD